MQTDLNCGPWETGTKRKWLGADDGEPAWEDNSYKFKIIREVNTKHKNRINSNIYNEKKNSLTQAMVLRKNKASISLLKVTFLKNDCLENINCTLFCKSTQVKSRASKRTSQCNAPSLRTGNPGRWPAMYGWISNTSHYFMSSVT